MNAARRGLVVLGNQLFPLAEFAQFSRDPVFMSEDQGLCTYVRHHQQKIVLFLAAMREHADAMRSRGFNLTYHRIEDNGDEPYEERLEQFVRQHNIAELAHFEIEDHFFNERIGSFCVTHGLTHTPVPSPMFLTSREEFTQYLEDASRPFMANFYKRQRKRMNILLQTDGSPAGGQWSFDDANRKKLPKGLEIPSLPDPARTDHTRDVIELVRQRFADHPGDAADFWWPVTRRSALHWLRDFVDQRLPRFGPYQDALSQHNETVFHSVLSPLLNMGLLTPRDVIDKTLEVAELGDIPINSLEGFIRQVLGWREFIRGIYHHYDAEQSTSNFWNHHRGLTEDWYTGNTGVLPLDHAIKTANRLGWTHHITRLMVVGNLMNLSEIEPRQVHDWFMETHVDSSDWVMGPNVYGMALFSDGGLFATKPYICGSNYLLKMSDFGKGQWCDVVDGLYWRFVYKHQEFFAANPRLSMMVSMLGRLQGQRREKIFTAADAFLAAKTTPP